MHILIDTAVHGCGIAFFNDKKVIDMRQVDIARGHAEQLLPLYEDMAKANAIKPQQIRAVYTTIGPGSFTGLRVGLTVARFIGYSLQVPVHGVTTLQAFAFGCESKGKKLVLIETKRQDYYCQIFDKDSQATNEAHCFSLTAIDALIENNQIDSITGDAVERFLNEAKHISLNNFQQDSINLKALIKSIQNETIEFHKAEAFYIRDADVSNPKY
jgi:tRNA threonylcarbamoyladenosine biosynthesis protein TsaB